jgi:hypothetical protein
MACLAVTRLAGGYQAVTVYLADDCRAGAEPTWPGSGAAEVPRKGIRNRGKKGRALPRDPPFIPGITLEY